MPFIRYEVGDSGAVSEQSCPCGRGLPLLEKLDGRIQSFVTTPEGKRIHGEFFTHIFWELPWARQFQIRQDSYDRIKVLIIPDTEPPQQQLDWLKEVIQARTGDSMKIDVSFESQIPVSPSGKRHFVISELSNEK